jgi:hypothetical protein
MSTRPVPAGGVAAMVVEFVTEKLADVPPSETSVVVNPVPLNPVP